MATKTITLTGAEVAVTGLDGAHAHIRNDSTDTIYAAKTAGITAGADGVASIPAGQADTLRGISGAVYLLGTGSALIQSDDYVESPFKASTASGGSAVDDVARAAINTHSGNNEIHVTAAEKEKWNGKAELSDIPDKLPADGGNADKLDGKHASDFVANMSNQNHHFSIVYGDNTYLTKAFDTDIPNLPVVANYTHIIDCSDNGKVVNVLSIGVDYTKNVYVYSRNSGIWKNIADVADTAKAVQSATGKASLYENGEGGNLKLVSPDGTKALEIDLYNNDDMRFVLWEDGNPIIPLDFNFSTKKFSITGDISNANNLESHPASDFVLKSDYDALVARVAALEGGTT